MFSLQAKRCLLYAVLGRLALPSTPKSRIGPDRANQLSAPSPHSSWLEPTVLVYYIASRGNGLICLLNLEKMRMVGKRDDVGGTRGGEG